MKSKDQVDKPARPDSGFARQRGDEIEDRDYRRTHAAAPVLRSAYWSIVGDVPRLSPGDREGAAQHLGRIRKAIERGHWKRSEWRRLYAMEKKWQARAEGRDTRFNMFGNRGFGLDKKQQARVKFADVVQQMKDILDDPTILNEEGSSAHE